MEIFGNNSADQVSYERDGQIYDLDENTWDLWVNGTRVDGLSKAQLPDEATINSFTFYGENSDDNTAEIILGDFVYSNFITDDPVINVVPTSVGGLDYFSGAGPSDAKEFKITAENLSPADGELQIAASTNFEVSLDNDTFDENQTLNYSDGELTDISVYVRLVDGLASDGYTGTVTISGGDADNATVNVSGGVISQPILTDGPYTQNFNSFVSATSLPNGWDLGSDYEYIADFDENENARGLRGNGVLGFQLVTSGADSEFSADLELTNNTGETIDALTISYLGKVERLDGTRLPKWRVSLDGNLIPDLTYKTESGEDEQKEFVLTGLSISDGDTFVITWATESDPDNAGSNRRIGLTDVSVGAVTADYEAPVFSAEADTFFTDQTISITNFSDYPAGVEVRYTLDNSTPNENSTLYNDADGIEISDGDGLKTLRAYAFNPDTDEFSFVSVVNYTFPVDVANLTELWDKQAERGLNTIFRLTGEATVTHTQEDRNQRAIQDSERGIMIDDPDSLLVTEFDGTASDLEIGDNVTGVVGSLVSISRHMRLQTVPGAPAAEIASRDNDVAPITVTLNELNTNRVDAGSFSNISVYQNRLVLVEELTFDRTGTFITDQSFERNIGISDPSASSEDLGSTMVFRTYSSEMDYADQDIPENEIDLTGFIFQFNNNVQISARTSDDFGASSEILPFALLQPASDSTLVIAEPDDDSSLEFSWESTTGTGDVSYTFQLIVSGGSFSDPLLERAGLTNTQTSYTITQLDSLLTAKEIDDGETLAAVWRVRATDDVDSRSSSSTFNLNLARPSTDDDEDDENGDDEDENGEDETPIASAPQFSVEGGFQTSAIEVEITTATEEASIFYTLDGSDPTSESTLYSEAISIDTTTTLKAIAIADEFENSEISSELYEFAIDVNSIAELKEVAQEGAIYRLTEEVVIHFQQNFRNTRMVTDASGGLHIDDAPNGTFNPGFLNEDYELYQGITGVTGRIDIFRGEFQLQPVIGAGEPSSAGVIIHPEVISIADITTERQGEFVMIHNVRFSDEGVFETGTNYEITSGEGDQLETGFFSTQYFDADYIGEAIPDGPVSIKGWIQTTGEGDANATHITARSSDDILEAAIFASFDLLEPADQVEIDVAGPENEIIRITWESADAPNRSVAYRWIATSPDKLLTLPEITQTADDTGIENALSFTVAELDDFLDNLVVEENGEITLKWTVIAQATFTESDSVHVLEQTATESRLVTFKRGVITSAEYDNEIPAKLSLSQNYPNPFNPTTVINYQVPVQSEVRLEVFDVLGRRVAVLFNGEQASGYHSVTFDASQLSSGMYLYRLQTGNQVITKKMTLVK